MLLLDTPNLLVNQVEELADLDIEEALEIITASQSVQNSRGKLPERTVETAYHHH